MDWTPALSVGIDKIDEQHRELFIRITNLVDAIKGKTCKFTIDDTIGFLEEYVNTHFSEEEAFMEGEGYPELADHQLEHRKFMEDFESFKAEVAHEPSSYTKSVLANQIVVDWILDHIKKVDMSFGAYMSGK